MTVDAFRVAEGSSGRVVAAVWSTGAGRLGYARGTGKVAASERKKQIFKHAITKLTTTGEMQVVLRT